MVQCLRFKQKIFEIIFIICIATLPAFAAQLPDVGVQIYNSNDLRYLTDGCPLSYSIPGRHLQCSTGVNVPALSCSAGSGFIYNISESLSQCRLVDLSSDVTGVLDASHVPSLQDPLVLKTKSLITSIDSDTVVVQASSMLGVPILVAIDGRGLVRELGGDVMAIVANNSGATIVKGAVVSADVASPWGISDVPNIVLADADLNTLMPAMGIAVEDIPNTANGRVFTFGTVMDIDTSPYALGDRLYVSGTPGSMTSVQPSYPAQIQIVGYVTKVGSTDGTIFVPGFASGSTNSSISLPVSPVIPYSTGTDLAATDCKWDITNKVLSCGITATDTLATGAYGIQIVGESTDNPRIQIVKYGANSGTIALLSAGGDQATPTATGSGVGLGILKWFGYDGTAFTTAASVNAQATENWTSGAHGTDIVFQTVAIGSTSNTARLTVGQTISVPDGGLFDLSGINASSTTEGFKFPQATDVSSATGNGQCSWDADDYRLVCGTGAGQTVVGGAVSKAVVWTAGGVQADGAQCAKSTAAINSGPKAARVNCADNAAGVIYLPPISTPTAWDAGTVTVTASAYSAAAVTTSNDNLGWDVSCFCGTVGANWGTAQNLDITLATQWVPVSATSAAITPGGTCAAGGQLWCRLVVDVAATDTTTADQYTTSGRVTIGLLTGTE